MAGASVAAGGNTLKASAGGASAAAAVRAHAANNPKISALLICLPRLRVVSERNSALPGDEIVLPERLGLGSDLAAGHLDDRFEYCLSHLFDCRLARDDRAGVDVNNVRHTSSEIGIGRDLDYRCHRIAGRRPQAGRE